ncbi:hypothetical protein XENOCAPTIV_013008 [Xenoophorus captivus]|uniref:peptidylprolyl isomerase n=1 Tax=Xenoophorus captivus TaxID=1517983 RepID=A0ABV0SAT0_9TELE
MRVKCNTCSATPCISRKICRETAMTSALSYLCPILENSFEWAAFKIIFLDARNLNCVEAMQDTGWLFMTVFLNFFLCLSLQLVKREGTGADFPMTGDKVFVHYVGTLLDGTHFDSSRDRGDTFSFELGKDNMRNSFDMTVEPSRESFVKENALEMDSTSEKALFRRGEALFEINEFERARDDFQRVKEAEKVKPEGKENCEEAMEVENGEKETRSEAKA